MEREKGGKGLEREGCDCLLHKSVTKTHIFILCGVRSDPPGNTNKPTLLKLKIFTHTQ